MIRTETPQATRRKLRWLAGALCLVPGSALAYIDPGTGSMLLQSLLAAIAAALVFGRTAWHRLKSFFRRDKDTLDSER